MLCQLSVCAPFGSPRAAVLSGSKCLPVRSKRFTRETSGRSQRIINVKAGTLSQTDIDLALLSPPGTVFDRVVLKSLTLSQLEGWCESIGERKSRAVQIWKWMYDKPLISDWTEAEGKQNGFSSAFLEKASNHATLDTGLRLESCIAAADGTRKLLFSLDESSTRVETVLIPVSREQVQFLKVNST